MIRTHLQEKPLTSSPHAPTKSQFAPRPFAPKAEEREAAQSNCCEPRIDFSLADIDMFSRPVIQPKLRLGPVGDKYEQEADQVAHRVVETISSSDLNSIQREEDEEEEPELEETLEEEEEERRLKVDVSAPAGGLDVGPDLESAIQRARGGGQLLSDGVRQPMERVFTTGQDMFFRQGVFRPGSSEGRRLLAHELTHVVQQKGGAVQRVQMQAAGRVLQAKEDVVPNRTGMPDHLKSGLENISGMDLSGVRVHYSSPKPAQLNALAYTQGQEIHVAPGQEKHLPHEGWHVVQQMQGRVKPTGEVGGLPLNDNRTLESEADGMGQKALQMYAQVEKPKESTPPLILTP